jgi:hypothetical protein
VASVIGSISESGQLLFANQRQGLLLMAQLLGNYALESSNNTLNEELISSGIITYLLHVKNGYGTKARIELYFVDAPLLETRKSNVFHQDGSTSKRLWIQLALPL